VWHASVSIQQRRRLGGRVLDLPYPVEHAALETLRGVGGDHEWWLWNDQARVGHLRVPVTLDELALIPAGLVTMDAGETGPRRPRTLP
jgi:hypothetical protein